MFLIKNENVFQFKVTRKNYKLGGKNNEFKKNHGISFNDCFG